VLLWLTYNRITVGLVIVLATFFMEVVYVEYPGFLDRNVHLSDRSGVCVSGLGGVVAPVHCRDFRAIAPWLLFEPLSPPSFALGLAQFGRPQERTSELLLCLDRCALFS
jgi:hypothetical protein